MLVSWKHVKKHETFTSLHDIQPPPQALSYFCLPAVCYGTYAAVKDHTEWILGLVLVLKATPTLPLCPSVTSLTNCLRADKSSSRRGQLQLTPVCNNCGRACLANTGCLSETPPSSACLFSDRTPGCCHGVSPPGFYFFFFKKYYICMSVCLENIQDRSKVPVIWVDSLFCFFGFFCLYENVLPAVFAFCF